MLFPQLNGYWYQSQWVEKIAFDILMTAWHQYKTNYDLSRNKLHHGGGGVQNSFLSIFGKQTDNPDNCSLIMLISLTSGTKGNQLLCRKMKDETLIQQLQHWEGGWCGGFLTGTDDDFPQCRKKRGKSLSVESQSCQQKRMQMNTQQQKFQDNTKIYLKRN